MPEYRLVEIVYTSHTKQDMPRFVIEKKSDWFWSKWRPLYTSEWSDHDMSFPDAVRELKRLRHDRFAVTQELGTKLIMEKYAVRHKKFIKHKEEQAASNKAREIKEAKKTQAETTAMVVAQVTELLNRDRIKKQPSSES